MKVRRKKGTSRFDFGLFSILHEDEFVRPRGAVVINGEEQGLHLTIFTGVVEPRLSTTEDGKDALVVGWMELGQRHFLLGDDLTGRPPHLGLCPRRPLQRTLHHLERPLGPHAHRIRRTTGHASRHR